MKKSSILTFVFLTLLVSIINAQTTITGVVTDSLNAPIPFASVYLSKTTVGTTTDNRGVYSLIIPQEGVYEMITSCVGFTPFSQIVNADGKMHWLNTKLMINNLLINEVTVKSRSRHRIRNFTEFNKLFIGNSYNAQSCRILNSEDIRLYENKDDTTIRGYSVKPLIIENNALGYRIIYDLTDFHFDRKTGVLKFSGNNYFQPINASPRKVKRWENNRLTLYYGSRMHLLRSIINDSLSRDKYKLFECNINPVTQEWLTNKPLQEKNLKLTSNSDYTDLYYNKLLLIKYTECHSEIPVGFMGYEPKEYESTIKFSDTLRVYKNGFYDNPYAIAWGGKMSIERLADMLPFDYIPNSTSKLEVDTNTVQSKFNRYFYSQQKVISRDQLFVHTDRNMYRPGDTLHFQSYVKDRLTGGFESSSTSMYAMLFNSEKIMVDSSRFKIEGSTSSGWMAIPSNAKSGKYYFVAFTSAMQNYDPADAFHLDLLVDAPEIDQISVDIVFGKEYYHSGETLEATIKFVDSNRQPLIKQKFHSSYKSKGYSIDGVESATNSLGESIISFAIPDTITNQPFLQISTKNRAKNESITKDFDIPLEDRFYDLKFLPEGGTLVACIEQRIGFNATNRKGESLRVKGLLKSQNGNVIDTIKSSPYGPGQFTCIPEEGMYVELINGVSDTQKKWPLTDISGSGLCLGVRPVSSRSFAVEVQSKSYNNEELFITGTMNATQLFSQEITLNKKKRIIVQTDQLPSGIAQITLFSKDLRPIAERLFYVNADKHLRFNITMDSSIYKPGQETKLAISVTDGLGNPAEGIFSMAIVDSTMGYNAEIFTPGIEYSLNYHPYLLSNLPPKALMMGLENITDNERDLLFLVYGWKKYSWDLNQKREDNLKEPIDYDLLNMKIHYALKSRQVNRRLDLLSMEGPSITHLLTNRNGEISMPLDSLPEMTRTVMIFPNTKNKMKIRGSDLSIPFNQNYFKSDKLFARMPIIPSYLYNVRPSLTKSFIPLTAKTLEIPELKFIGNKKTARNSAYAKVQGLDREVLWSSHSFQEALFKVTTPTIRDGKVYLQPGRGSKHPPVPATIIVDGFPEELEDASVIHPMNIISLTVVAFNEGGAIIVNTRTKNPYILKLQTEWKIKHLNDKMLLPINIYRTNVEFYNPTKAEVDTNPKFQNSPTIFWKEEIQFDAKGPVTIKYPNLKNVKHNGTAIITINGVSLSNMAGTGRASYKIQDSN